MFHCEVPRDAQACPAVDTRAQITYRRSLGGAALLLHHGGARRVLEKMRSFSSRFQLASCRRQYKHHGTRTDRNTQLQEFTIVSLHAGLH